MEIKPDASTTGHAAFTAPLAFERRLSDDKEWGLSEGSLFLEGKGIVHETLRRICKRLDELQIPYAVVGGMALFEHGFERFTKDVDLLVTPEGLREVHEKLEGLGYVAPFSRSKNLRDTQTGVRIEFLVTGQFPGDGRPKPVAFPDPERVAVYKRGLRILDVKPLVELKLASGMTTDRIKDLGDVQELIKVLGLGLALSDELNPYVRQKYRELWQGVHGSPRRFLRHWTWSAATADQLATILADGVELESPNPSEGQEVRLITSDPELAHKHQMHDESEFMDPQ